MVVKKLKDRHWKEHLFVAAMPGVIEIVGLITGVLDLAGQLRDFITGMYDLASDSFGETSGCFRFVKYLTVVEEVLRPYMNPAWQEISAMRGIVDGVRVELQGAWNLASDLLETNGWWRTLRADRFANDLEKSQAAIQSFLSLIPIAALTRTAQDGQEHNGNGNEDSDYAFALSVYENDLRSLHDEEQREANRGESSQARAMEASLDEEKEMVEPFLWL